MRLWRDFFSREKGSQLSSNLVRRSGKFKMSPACIFLLSRHQDFEIHRSSAEERRLSMLNEDLFSAGLTSVDEEEEDEVLPLLVLPPNSTLLSTRGAGASLISVTRPPRRAWSWSSSSSLSLPTTSISSSSKKSPDSLFFSQSCFKEARSTSTPLAANFFCCFSSCLEKKRK